MTLATPSSDPGRSPDPGQDTLFFGPDGLRAGWSLLLFFAILAPLVFLLVEATHRSQLAAPAPATQHRPATPSQILIPEALELTLLAIATCTMSRVERRPVAAYGIALTRRSLRQGAAGALCGLACLSLLILTLTLTGHLAFDARLLSGAVALQAGAVWLAGFLLVGLLEEYFLRGFLQFTLARGLAGLYEALDAPHANALGFWTAALILSLLFGLGHNSNPGESPLGLLSAGLVGLVFCLSLRRTGSVLWAIGFHAAWDWAQSFLYGVADSGTLIQDHLYATHPLGPTLLSGGTTGPEGSLFILPTLALAALLIHLTLPASRVD